MIVDPFLLNSLRHTPLLNHLPPDALNAIAQAVEIQCLQAGEIIFHQDELGTDMYIIKTGSVKVVLADKHGQELVLNEYGPGRIFGELALLSNRPRAATVVATSATAVYKLTREVFARFVTASPTEGRISLDALSDSLRLRYKAQSLKRISLFAALTEDDLITIAQHVRSEQFNHGDVLFERGDNGDALYIVMRGWVNAFLNSPDGELIVLNQFGPGDIFGEMSLVDEKPRSAGIRALSHLELLTLPRQRFMELIGQYPKLALATLESLSSKMRFAATYVEQAIVWSQKAAAGDYSMVLEEIEASNDNVVGAQESDQFRVSALLSAFFKMIQNMQEREDALRKEISSLRLKIEIDQQQRREQVHSITENAAFAALKKQAQRIRAQENTTEEQTTTE